VPRDGRGYVDLGRLVAGRCGPGERFVADFNHYDLNATMYYARRHSIQLAALADATDVASDALPVILRHPDVSRPPDGWRLEDVEDLGRFCVGRVRRAHPPAAPP
jgi:hypothetical protein